MLRGLALAVLIVAPQLILPACGIVAPSARDRSIITDWITAKGQGARPGRGRNRAKSRTGGRRDSSFCSCMKQGRHRVGHGMHHGRGAAMALQCADARIRTPAVTILGTPPCDPNCFSRSRKGNDAPRPQFPVAESQWMGLVLVHPMQPGRPSTGSDLMRGRR
jgi:hypothetical protein